MKNRELPIEELIVATVAALGACVWGFECLNQGKYSVLRIFAEREEGISVDLCAEISRHVSDLLDVEEIMPSAYTLEVSSPGMDRLLFKSEQYAAHVGERLDVRLNYPFEGRKKIVGTLRGLEDNSVVLQVDDDEYLLPLENVQKARIVPMFD